MDMVAMFVGYVVILLAGVYVFLANSRIDYLNGNDSTGIKGLGVKVFGFGFGVYKYPQTDMGKQLFASSKFYLDERPHTRYIYKSFGNSQVLAGLNLPRWLNRLIDKFVA